MPNQIISLGETCGIEFETEEITPNVLVHGWKNTHDASIESDTYVLNSFGGITVKKENIDENLLRLLSYQNIVVGTELVSPILDVENNETLEMIKKLVSTVFENGESAQGKRCGIHFHISLPNPSLTILKTILRLGRYFEALFFTLGGMGYEFRGVENDSTYCRPITQTGPVCVPFKGDFVQIFNIDDLLKTKTREEFWYLYGDCQNHSSRYNPIRYHWLNLYPMNPYSNYRGTLEFRIFNKTLNPLYIYSSLKLCKNFVQLVLNSSYSTLKGQNFLDENSVYNPTITKNDLQKHLLRLHELTEFDDITLEILMTILDRSPQTILNPGYIHSHIRGLNNDYWRSERINYNPRSIETKIKRPRYVDIHVLRGER